MIVVIITIVWFYCCRAYYMSLIDSKSVLSWILVVDILGIRTRKMWGCSNHLLSIKEGQKLVVN